MPPKVTVEEFDDDTDLPLPTRSSLPNTGLRGAVLEEIGRSSPVVSTNFAEEARSSSQLEAPAARKQNIITDVTPYKKLV